ncbi:MAG: hypothetical protein ACJAVN_001713 [Roseivirga sp.]|jgi:hypothetical protein
MTKLNIADRKNKNDKKMKTQREWEHSILEITNTIHQKFPELSKYIMEMPENNSENDQVTIKTLKSYYYSLKDFLNNYEKMHPGEITKKSLKPPVFLGYPSSEDIYTKGKKEMNLNPENPSKSKVANEDNNAFNEKEFKDDMSGDDLDVPGSELDDQQESVGSEDEENNYYSLGGDNHNDLEEDKR